VHEEFYGDDSGIDDQALLRTLLRTVLERDGPKETEPPNGRSDSRYTGESTLTWSLPTCSCL